MRRVKLFFKGTWKRFKNSQFVAHISFLWHWKNFFFFMKYPFWKCYSRWDDKFMGYGYSEYNLIPKGWKIAFGKQLSEDIKKAGKESRRRLGYHSWKKLITWQDIKEKYGELRLYAEATDEITHVLERYELLSLGYCVNCGKPARYKTRGWIEYYCEDCFISNLGINHSQDEIQKELKDCRLTKKDIPSLTSYTTTKEGKLVKHKVNLKRIYDIDFETLWCL